jgi:carbamoyl-phosphate synthase large subunit
MNIVISSAGRRSYLVNFFREVLKGKGKVIATNSTMDATAMFAADVACVLPVAGDEEFINRLLDICQKFEAKLLFSLHDWEAPFIAQNRERFLEIDTFPVVSKPEVIDCCLDKLKTYNFAHDIGMLVPNTFDSLASARAAIDRDSINFPLILKPRFGQGSIGIEIVEDIESLLFVHGMLLRRLEKMKSNELLMQYGTESILIQEYLEGDEYGLDVVNDLDGNFMTCFAKRKFGMRSGETDIAETVNDLELLELGKRIGMALNHIGMLDVDVMRQDGRPYILEMNPRFGGHYPFSHIAGANIPAALLAMAEGKAPRPEWLRVETGVRSYKDIVLLKQPSTIVKL